MQPIVRSLEAAYAGYGFRSWMEARYAVFWDMLSIMWAFEPGAVCDSVEGGYLPDFLVQIGGLGQAWVEIKPFLSTATDPEPMSAEVQRTIRIMTGLCNQPSDMTEGRAVPGVIFAGDPGPGSAALVVWPRRPHAKIYEAALGVCPFCGSFCLLAEEPPKSNRYMVMCHCPRVVPHYRLSAIDRRRCTHDPMIVAAARVARGRRFDTPAMAAADEAATLRGRARMTPAQVQGARARRAAGESVAHIAKSYAVCESTVRRAIYGITWKGVV